MDPPLCGHCPDVPVAAAAKSLQSCPSPPGSPVPGILQARTLEWVAKVKVKSLRRVRLLATPWTTAHQAPPSMGFSRQEYWSRGHRLLHQSILAPFILLQKVAPSALLGSKVQKHYIPPAPSIGPISPLIPRSFYNFKSSSFYIEVFNPLELMLSVW